LADSRQKAGLMIQFENITSTEKIKVDINIRVGAFLLEQRSLKGNSVRTVARKLKIKRAKIRKWENAKASPPCNVFYRMASFYGKLALQSAAKLDLQFQLEKYQRLLEQQKVLKTFQPKCPAVIWSEVQYKKLAA
jgi:transcriptional regulator with XRE-family HTH domain